MMSSPIPVPLSSLVGRELDIERIAALIIDGARLVTLTGLGGVGKTRLAIAVAQRLDAAGLATAYCDTAAVAGVAELALALARAMAVEISPESGSGTLMSALARALGVHASGPVLAVVDNFEQLVGLPGEAAVTGLRSCLEHAPWLTVLVTSRIALPRSAGTTVVVSPIASDGLHSPAMRLLMERAARVGATPDWQRDELGVARLAARLEGLPLALELVAARAHALGPAELLARFDDQPASGERDMVRLRDAVVAWSWGVLSHEQRAALLRLEAVDGSCAFGLAVTLIGGARTVALEVLEALVRVSLVMVEPSADGARYRMLETVREFVRTQAVTEHDELRDEVSALLLARLPDVDEMVLYANVDLTFVLVERDLFLAALRRGLEAGARLDTRRLALTAAVWLLLALRRTGFGPAIAERVEQLLAHAAIETLPLSLRTAASLLTITVRIGDARTAEVDALLERAEGWASSSELERPRLVLQQLRATVAQYRWNFPQAHSISSTLIDHPIIRSDLRILPNVVTLYVNGRRALGLADFPADEALLLDVASRLPPPDKDVNALLLLGNRGFHAVQMGLPVHAMALANEVERAATACGFKRLAALARRDRARAETDLGLRREALTTFDTSLAILSGTHEGVEGLLERCATALEAGHYERVRHDLDALEPMLSTSFERGYHGALSKALAALLGEPVEPTPPERTGTIEDTTFALLAAIGTCSTSADAALREAAREHAPSSFRTRQAVRLFEATRSLNADAPDVVAVDFEAHAFRLGAHWVHLDRKPLLACLFEALAWARLDGVTGVERTRLMALAWPDTQVRREHLERRLETAISALRKVGLKAIATSAVNGHAGYAIAPSLTVLRVRESAWSSSTASAARCR